MKHWFVFLSFLLNTNAFTQFVIDKSETVTLNTNQIVENTSHGEFVKEFLIENSDKQPFVTANIILKGKFNEDVELFVRYKTIFWSKWVLVSQDIHFNKKGSISKEMIYLPQGVKSFEIRGDLKKNTKQIKIDFFYPEFTNNLNKSFVNYNVRESLLSVNCNCPMPAFEARADWCPTGNCPAQSNPTLTNVSHLIIHHAAGPNTSTDWAATVRSIWNYHVNSNGWSDIGYNYLVAPDGTIFEGRGDNILGAHFSGMNGGTMGICLLGDYEPSSGNGTPSAIMISKLEELLSWKECDLDIDPLLSSYHAGSSQTLFNISGHRDAGTGTVCPGDNVYNLLPNIRATCSSYMTNCSFASDADLVVSSLATIPSSVFLNQNTNINYSIGNVGSLSVTDSIKIDLEIDGAIIQTDYLDSLGAGNIESFALANYLFDTIGDHLVCVYISAATNEINISNNSYCKTVTVSEDLDFSDINISTFYVDNDNISIDDEAKIFYTFSNIGDESTSETVDAKILVDNVVKQSITLPILAVNDFYSGDFSYNFNTIGVHDFCIDIESPTNETVVANNSDCENISIFPVNGIEAFEGIISFQVFPNPVENLFTIELNFENSEIVHYSLKNVLGQSLFSKTSTNSINHLVKVNVEDFAKGVYFLNIKVGTKSFYKTIIIE